MVESAKGDQSTVSKGKMMGGYDSVDLVREDFIDFTERCRL